MEEHTPSEVLTQENVVDELYATFSKFKAAIALSERYLDRLEVLRQFCEKLGYKEFNELDAGLSKARLGVVRGKLAEALEVVWTMHKEAVATGKLNGHAERIILKSGASR